MEKTQAQRREVALSTKAPVTEELKRRLFGNQDLSELETLQEVLSTFLSMANLGRKADIQKRTVFYGKKQDKPLEMLQYPETKPKLMAQRLQPDAVVDLLHGVIGKVTELGEICESLMTFAETGELDLVNLKEELGDDDWYNQIICSFLGCTLAELQALNEEKLTKKRYKAGYSDQAAVNRNLTEERIALEGKQETLRTESVDPWTKPKEELVD